ncbi:hypothetical protein [Sinosporangium siamense]|uniref:Uncharacterized protein n=1 Tax=Sinosporangium siamense TaxID=1367973 RepID=A0A919RGE3_9ACTN|nr:hypothetical protein [Sinosporangium siamense]GII92285.1 hypothetical protein Ssi02_25160 [Sinosporangium siamense]
MRPPGILDPRRALSLLPFRARLAVAFSTLFLLAGAALLAFVVILARYGTAQQLEGIDTQRLDGPLGGTASPVGPLLSTFGRTGESGPLPLGNNGLAFDGVSVRRVETTVQAVQDAALQQMLLWSGVGLVIMAFLAGLIGWWPAGRCGRSPP